MCRLGATVSGGGWRPRGECSSVASLAPTCNLCMCTVVCLGYIRSGHFAQMYLQPLEIVLVLFAHVF